MAKTKKAPPETTSEGGGKYPVPFTLDAFRKDITNVFLHYVRNIGWMTDGKTAWAITGSPPVADSYQLLFDPDNEADELGLKYDHIRHTPFATTLEQLYELAFFGRIDANSEDMGCESIHMWITGLVYDAHYGKVAYEWDTYGLDILSNTEKCLRVTEIANARHTLEGGEPFFNHFLGTSKEEAAGFDSLTIRQMALLAGMEEMSIRSAANPKRANHLQTHSADGGTRIDFEVAKAWLKLKGRYVPITRYWTEGEVDLAKRRFTDPADLWRTLNSRYRMLGQRDGLDQLNAQLVKGGLPIAKNIMQEPFIDIDESHMGNEAFMRSIAELIDLPADLLVLRCKEVLAKQQLANIEQELRAATQSTNQKQDPITNP